MLNTVLLGAWSLVLGWGALRPRNQEAPWLRISLTLVVASLLLSPFWHAVVRAFWQSEPSPLSVPHQALWSLWFLVLWPIAQRRLTTDTLVQNLVLALIAAAAIGLALDHHHALRWVLPPADSSEPSLLLAAWLSFPAGLTLCLFARPQRLPWEYPAWHFGWFAIAAG
ncbi:hypothetical protein [Rhabdochromatium marinum]|uniref:hypothetical protein n=1 Tax=Rhabdochromatium marinum TaxID=48729 RepID=UPI001906AA6F|nr:hypothetical protein [Rhabdochromatium marinum]MBK1648337.1 hypothetical protein [Rhabdochromatium marinum]